MKSHGLLVFLFFVLNTLTVSAQKVYPIALDDDPRRIPFENRNFYIAAVIDERIDTTNIGIVQTGAFNSQRVAMFYDDCAVIVKEYYDSALPKGENQVPITIKIKKLRIDERTGATSERGWVDLEADFYSGNRLVYHTVQHKEYTGLDVTKNHPENIVAVLENAVIEFNNSNWRSNVGEQTETPAADTTSAPSGNTSKRIDKQPMKETNGNVFAIGYQIGGLTLIGAEYEIRFHDYFGANIGIGYPGFTYGLKIHTRPGKNAPFFNISYKDGGFGLMRTAGVEYGGRLRFSRGAPLAFHYQAGLAKILYIDDNFAKILYKGNPVPPLTLSLGLGLSW
jgi:hypothetical protein